MDNLRDSTWSMLHKLNQVILGKELFIANTMAALFAGGHILIEDIPGVGKTTLALTISKIMGLDWKRVQFTPDVLPSDLTGFSIYDKQKGAFVYQPGAVFCNLLLADEINRTSPKTQSALLEVMEERQVTVDGLSRAVPDPFFVIATQNPSGTIGTQLLPPAQIDRFMVSLTMGYPDFQSELIIAKEVISGSRTNDVTPLINKDDLKNIQQAVSKVYIHDSIYQYIVRLVTATRNHPHIELGASPRATIALVKMAKASAWIREQDFVTINDVISQFLIVTRHRITMSSRSRSEKLSKDDILSGIIDDTEKPILRRA